MSENENKVLSIAKTVLPDVRTMVDAALKFQGVSLETDAPAYYKASRQVFRAFIACAAQRMLEDGAKRSLVRNTASSHAGEDGWELLLETHPEVKAKVQAELEKLAAAKEEFTSKFALMQGGVDDDADEDEDAEEDSDSDEE